MKLPARPWIWLVVALAVLVLVGMVLQTVNQLLWQLSYWLPGWLVGPITLLLLAGLLLVLARLVWPWLQGGRRLGRRRGLYLHRRLGEGGRLGLWGREVPEPGEDEGEGLGVDLGLGYLLLDVGETVVLAAAGGAETRGRQLGRGRGGTEMRRTRGWGRRRVHGGRAGGILERSGVQRVRGFELVGGEGKAREGER